MKESRGDYSPVRSPTSIEASGTAGVTASSACRSGARIFILQVQMRPTDSRDEAMSPMQSSRFFQILTASKSKLESEKPPYEYPLDKYLVRNHSYPEDLLNLLQDFDSEPAHKKEDDFSKPIDILLSSVSNIFKDLDDLISLFQKQPEKVKLSEPIGYDEQYDEEVYVREVVDAKFNGNDLIDDIEFNIEKPKQYIQEIAEIYESEMESLIFKLKSAKVIEDMPEVSSAQVVTLPTRVVTEVSRYKNAIGSNETEQSSSLIESPFSDSIPKARKLKRIITKLKDFQPPHVQNDTLAHCTNFTTNSKLIEINCNFESSEEINADENVKKFIIEKLPGINIKPSLVEQKIPTIEIFSTEEANMRPIKTRSNIGILTMKDSTQEQEQSNVIERESMYRKLKTCEKYFGLMTDEDDRVFLFENKLKSKEPLVERFKQLPMNISRLRKLTTEKLPNHNVVSKITRNEKPDSKITRLTQHSTAASNIKTDLYSKLSKNNNRTNKQILITRTKTRMTKSPYAVGNVRPATANVRRSKNDIISAGPSKIKEVVGNQQISQEYVPYSKLTLGGVSIEELESEISMLYGNIDTDLPLSPIVQKLLSLKASDESADVSENSYENLHENGSFFVQKSTLEKSIVKDNKQSSLNVNLEINEREKNDNQSSIKNRKGNLSDSNSPSEESTENDQEDYDDDFDERIASSSDSEESDKVKDDETVTKIPINTSETAVSKPISSLSLKYNIDTFDFVHNIDIRDDFTQSSVCENTMKGTQTSPVKQIVEMTQISEESNNISHSTLTKVNDEFGKSDGRDKNEQRQQEIEESAILTNFTLRDIEKGVTFIGKGYLKNILKEKMPQEDIPIGIPSSSSQGLIDSLFVPKTTQTSPHKIKHTMTSPARKVNTLSSPIFQTRNNEQQTSPFPSEYDSEHLAIDHDKLHSEELSCPQFSLKLPNNYELLTGLHSVVLKDSSQKKSRILDDDSIMNNLRRLSTSSDNSHSEASNNRSFGEIPLDLKAIKSNFRLARYKGDLASSDSNSCTSSSSASKLRSISNTNAKSDGEMSLFSYGRV